MSLFNKSKRLRRGEHAEKTALRYLKKQGLSIVRSNYYSRFGEIDLIAYDNETIVFVEVRSRAQGAQVSAEESITHTKIQKIRKTAEHYLMQFDVMPDCRFDVIAMTHNRDRAGYTINWIKNAF